MFRYLLWIAAVCGAISCGDDTVATRSKDAGAAVDASDGGWSADADASLVDVGGKSDVDVGPPALHSCLDPSGAVPPLQAVIAATGLASPVGIASSRDDPTRIYVLEKAGRVRILKDGQLLPTPFLDLSGVVWAENEAGLLGLAFHPDYETNGRFWVYYTIYEWDGSHLAEFRRSSTNPDVADPNPVGGAPIFKGLLSFIHQGGGLEFGPDGMLYLAMGDRDSGVFAQDPANPLGKVLRLDVSTHPFVAPAGNLLGGHPLVWDYGLRNPWRISFDRCDGTLFIADVGQFLREEINIEPKGNGNRNYGWPTTEGKICVPVGTACDTSTITLPALDYTHEQMNVIIGGYVYRGSAIPGLRSRYVYGDTQGRIYALAHTGGSVTASGLLPVAPLTGVLVSFGQDATGEIYTAEMQSGTIRRLAPQ